MAAFLSWNSSDVKMEGRRIPHLAKMSEYLVLSSYQNGTYPSGSPISLTNLEVLWQQSRKRLNQEIIISGDRMRFQGIGGFVPTFPKMSRSDSPQKSRK
jgi:hypothetical protein